MTSQWPPCWGSDKKAKRVRAVQLINSDRATVREVVRNVQQEAAIGLLSIFICLKVARNPESAGKR